MYIAFFDSGIGGITVLRELYSHIPDENFIYYADTKNLPYGTKNIAEVRRFIFEAAEFLAKQSIKMLVVACNTATSAAINELREKYTFPIIGMEPAIKPAIRSGRGRRILLLATSLTLREKKLENLIRSVDIHRKVDKLPLDRLVEYAEKLDFSSNDVQRYIREEFDTVDINQYETVVLGCTHFIYYRELLKAILPDGVDIIDGNEGTVRNILRHLKEDVLVSRKSTEGGEIHFYSSGIRESEEKKRKLLGLIK